MCICILRLLKVPQRIRSHWWVGAASLCCRGWDPYSHGSKVKDVRNTALMNVLNVPIHRRYLFAQFLWMQHDCLLYVCGAIGGSEWHALCKTPFLKGVKDLSAGRFCSARRPGALELQYCRRKLSCWTDPMCSYAPIPFIDRRRPCVRGQCHLRTTKAIHGRDADLVVLVEI